MNPSRRLAWLLVPLLLACTLPAGLPTGGGCALPGLSKSALDAMPADLDGLSVVDLQAMRASPLLLTVVRETFGTGDNELAEKCGFDPLAKIKRLTIGMVGDEAVVGVEGELGDALVVGCLAKLGAPVLAASVVGTRTHWRDPSGALVLAQAAPGLILVGTPLLVTQSLQVFDGAMPSVRTNRALNDAIGSVATTHAARGAYLCNGRTSSVDRLCGRSDFVGVEALSGGFSMSTDLAADVRTRFESDALAAERGEMFKLLALGLLIGMEVSQRERQFDVTATGPNVDMKFRMSADAVLRIVRSQRSAF
jgi:hypothetical protein